MRLLIDSMILVMALAILVGAVSYRHAKHRREQDLQAVQAGLDQFDEQLAFQGALWQSEQEEVGDYPPQVMPDWFRYGLPSNPLLSSDRPWIDIAPANDFSEHPPNPLASEPEQAAFWYNPNLGIVRARVPRQVSTRLTLELYNAANHTYLTALPQDDDPDRAPVAFNPNPVTAGLHASPDKRTIGQIQARDPQAVADDEPTAPADDRPQEVPWWQKRAPADAATPEPEPAEPEHVPSRPSLLAD